LQGWDMPEANKRKTYIVDKKFQLKQAFSIIRIEFIIATIITILIGLNAAYNNHKLAIITKKNDEVIKNQDNIIMIQDNIIETIMTWAQDSKGRLQKKAIRDVYNLHNKNINTIKDNINTIKNNIATINGIIRYNYILLFALLSIIIVQSLILFFVMIRKSHKISGPIYVISNYMKDIIDGKIPNPRPLRKGDELLDFYELFKEMVETLKKKGDKK
jgi:hypothetical protein